MWKLRIWQDLKVILKLLFCTIQFMDLIFSYICEQQVSLCVYQSSTGFRFGFISCLGSVENVQSVPAPIKQCANESNSFAVCKAIQFKIETVHPDFKVYNISKNQLYPFSRLQDIGFSKLAFLSVDFRRFLKGAVSRDFLACFYFMNRSHLGP